MNNKQAKKERKEIRFITQTKAADKFNDYMRKASLKVRFYRIGFFVYTMILIIVVAAVLHGK